MIEKELKNNGEFKNLCRSLASFKNEKEVANFLRDVCSYSEIEAMSERLEAARLVKKGVPYRQINKETGTSTATITRVAQWLNHGCGGYLKALEFLK